MNGQTFFLSIVKNWLNDDFSQTIDLKPECLKEADKKLVVCVTPW